MQQEQGEDSSLLRAAEVEGRLAVSDLERPKNAKVEHRRRTYHGIRVDREFGAALSAGCQGFGGGLRAARAMVALWIS